MCDSIQNPHPCPDQLLGAAGVAVRGHCLPSLSEAGVGRRGRLWAICAVVDTEAQEGDGPLVQSLQRTLESRGSASSRPAAGERAADVVLENSLFSTAPPQPRPPSLPESSPSPASISPPASVRVCACVCLGEGRLGSGIPHGKAAQSLPRAVRDPEPKQEAGRPRPGSGPSPDFPPGWGRNDSPPSPFTPVSLFAFLLPATWRPLPPLTTRTPAPGPRRPWHTSPGRSCPLGFLRSLAGARPTTLESRLHPRPMPAPFFVPSPTVRPGASSPPSQPVPERRRGRGAQGGVTAPARTSASCSLASVPGASWLIRLGRRWRFGAPCRRGGSPPHAPCPLRTQKELLHPARCPGGGSS